MKGILKVIIMKNNSITLMSARFNKAINDNTRFNLKKSHKKHAIFVALSLKF